jgi:DNA invertase Pin-like site-specific DNA recombinase
MRKTFFCMRGGILNKARRGELEIRLPIGFDYDPAGRVRLDPDVRVQESLRQFFRTFRRTGSATGLSCRLSFPHRMPANWQVVD